MNNQFKKRQVPTENLKNIAKCLKRQVSATLGLKSRKKRQVSKEKNSPSVCIAKCLKNVKSQTLGNFRLALKKSQVS